MRKQCMQKPYPLVPPLDMVPMYSLQVDKYASHAILGISEVVICYCSEFAAQLESFTNLRDGNQWL